MEFKCIKPFVAALACLWAVSCGTSPNPVIEVEGGSIVGVLNESHDVISYKGIPYAAPPVGELRWKKPQPVIPWDGVRECSDYGLASWQVWNSPDTFTGKEFYWTGPQPMGEDCLTLNVWTPADASSKPAAKLPVAMYIHGGGFTIGLSNHNALDGEYWAQQGVVTVIINYRLGHMGFFCHPLLSAEDPDGVSGNYGLYDQVAALKWVRNNIAQFGGDPDNITVFGQSAGAMSVKDLVISPLAKGLVSKAIMQSGGGVGSPLGGNSAERNDAIGKALADFGGLETLEDLRSISADDFAALADRFSAETGMRPVTSPYEDGVIMTETVAAAIQDGTLFDIPYIIGATADDMPFGKGAVLDEFCQLRNTYGSKPVYQYEFARKLPGDDQGAFHGADLWFTFHTVGRNWRPWTEADYELSERMIRYWTNFAKYGDPNGKPGSPVEWPAYTGDNGFKMVLDVKD